MYLIDFKIKIYWCYFILFIIGRHLGMAVECWNEDGRPVFNECGELVCTKPFPSMPIYFFGDYDFKKYKSSYFSKYPG